MKKQDRLEHRPVSGGCCGGGGSRWLIGTVAMMVIGITGCASTGVQQGGDASLRAPAGHRIEVARSYEHEVKTPEGLIRQVVEYGWDYTDAVAVERITTTDGEPVSFQQVPGQFLRANDAELEEAWRLFREHDELRDLLAGDEVHFEGGFVHMVQDDAYCHLRSRCIYVFATLDHGRKKIAQSIVDLQTGKVVYPFFDPGLVGPGN